MNTTFGNNGSVLQFVGTVQIPDTAGEFVAKEKFPVHQNGESNGKLCYAKENFKSWFLFKNGKIEKPILERTLRIYKLLTRSLDSVIIEELGGEMWVEITLTEIYELIERQSNGGGYSLRRR